MRKFILFLATGAGSGYAPVAPGTFGSLVGLLLFATLAAAGSVPGYLLCLVGVTGVGIWASARAEQILGRHDDGRITIDEVAGMGVALLGLPLRLDVALAAFVLFRLFDITKPPPVRQAERLPGGMGVMADDLVAGVYANLAGQLLWRIWFPNGF